MTTPQNPGLTFLATINVAVGQPIEVGETAEGHRRIIPIIGGTVQGPELNGSVLPAGADFQILKSETVTELQAQYAIETDDGDRIYVSNFGLRSGSAEDIAALVRGESVPPERIYFRCSPRLSSAGGRWAWLGSKIIIGTGERHPDAVRLNLFVVE
ncbi:DUF3237 domain-containing protein [Arthrobacter crystallopoietes]|uniref:UPF0311 protein SAMN04489742_2726 n=1 Tax=Crystallibacter crystallopoietes TaxID=37928 RepID=A0A1H1E2A3_9MICC|nr:DUF3237 domain-containing protein [Arthrobacter crystallopoietes]AUI50072.1 hypothetical protein AC20117_03815 [Arthrobacter crystallopoietes]SDQ82773.1 Protein of unknown function [Arthrobacter crystallopoietes]